jgi:hypothetical protein
VRSIEDKFKLPDRTEDTKAGRTAGQYNRHAPRFQQRLPSECVCAVSALLR